MLKTTDIYVDKNLKETTKHGTPDYPLEIYLDKFSSYAAGYPEWHWHDELEFCLVTAGTVDYHVADRRVLLAPGEGLLIAPGSLHQAKPVEGDCQMIAILASHTLIAGQELSAIDKKYVRPFLFSGRIGHVALRPSVGWQGQILTDLNTMCALYTQKEYGFELEIRNLLASAWLRLVRSSRGSLPEGPDRSAAQDDGRIKQMLSFIHAHFTQEIALADIARAASVSTGECCRCFQRTLKTTPFSYLMRHRILQAAERIQKTDAPITEIAGWCGFAGTSYFNKVFRRYMGCTPTQYRRRRDASG